MIAMADFTKEIEGAISNLPTLSPTAMKVMQVAQLPDASPKHVVKVIMLDPVLTGKVLKLINSAFYGMKQEVGSVAQAVVLLGLNTVKNLAFSTSMMGLKFLREKHAGINIDQFWRHSLATAVGARLIANMIDVDKDAVEEYFICGLLHDIGKIVFLSVCGQEFADAVRDARETFSNLTFSEMQHTGFDHTDTGAMLAEKWRLHGNIAEVLESHHSPHGDLSFPSHVKAVCIANNMVKAAELGFSGNVLVEEIYRELIIEMGLTVEGVEKEFEKLPAALEQAAVFLNVTQA